MIDALSLVIGLTRVWTATYTVGLGAEVKAGRRDEIESDLWDQQRLASMQEEPALDTAGHVFSRLLLGIPADGRLACRSGPRRAQGKESQHD